MLKQFFSYRKKAITILFQSSFTFICINQNIWKTCWIKDNTLPVQRWRTGNLQKFVRSSEWANKEKSTTWRSLLIISPSMQHEIRELLGCHTGPEQREIYAIFKTQQWNQIRPRNVKPLSPNILRQIPFFPSKSAWNIIWFNLPYNNNISTNIKRYFLNLVKNTFQCKTNSTKSSTRTTWESVTATC